MGKNLLLILVALSFLACRDVPESSPSEYNAIDITMDYAEGLRLREREYGYELTVKSPWQNAKQSVTYYLVRKGFLDPNIVLDSSQTISIPISNLVATSTTHIPPLDMMRKTKALVGFPSMDYISSPEMRTRIDQGKVVELGKKGKLDIERILTLNPDVVMGYAVDKANRDYLQLNRAGVPVIYNAEWVEQHPLGRAEWILLYGALFDDMERAQKIFNKIENEYVETKELASSATYNPTVMAGAPYKDVWYAPAGNSWQARMLADAGADYIYADIEGTGSLSYATEQVLADAADTDFWIAPSQYTSIKRLSAEVKAAEQFNAYKNAKIFTFALTTGETGGVEYYEKASMRPDIVLKDLVHILHPEMLKNYQPYFFKPLVSE